MGARISMNVLIFLSQETGYIKPTNRATMQLLGRTPHVEFTFFVNYLVKLSASVISLCILFLDYKHSLWLTKTWAMKT